MPTKKDKPQKKIEKIPDKKPQNSENILMNNRLSPKQFTLLKSLDEKLQTFIGKSESLPDTHLVSFLTL